ncbi:ISAzo13 family transposase [Actinoplanes sp. TBRC 11911]|uniref:ISAzo13 family transposase n=1 Tax=Actinoplanes sp. TBRC 11911 TaxID=2729386 RepID=UPI00145E1C4D|nr:ISAzo13 family transposase [Actinoplanes sp. TBRC 11911]NMO57906.1 ISAzo13 family transposase [Actinoplanes sp. TBRC 11911]
MGVSVEVQEQLVAKFETILPHLDERQRRLLMGAEARVLGHGGIRAVARAAGVREATVALGVDELDSGVVPLGRIRRPGGGRKKAAALDPGLRPALMALVEPDERGDPMSPLRWTTKSTRNLAAELTRQGHPVSADTVADLLREDGFSLQGNTKTLEGKQHPDRDGQFRYLNEQARTHRDAGQPVISVDTKKKELIGAFKNPGRQWRPTGQPVPVNTHDFPGDSAGKAVPYGIYDITANTGWVNVGTDHDTAAFAVESIRRWWHTRGSHDYPTATRLLITADAGGSNGYRSRAWKTELADLATETGLAITVCHLPPGTSKWNKIEHRLFCHITMNWRGRPLTSHEVILQSIAATTTGTGLSVHAQLDTNDYPTGIQISDAHMAALPIARHSFHGDWNYTLHPSTPDNTTAANTATERPESLSHPTFTGMTTDELTALTTALQAILDARREATNAAYQQAVKTAGDNGTRPHAPRSGRPPTFAFRDRVLATILHLRLSLPPDTLAHLFTSNRSTICRAIRQTRQLLDQHGTTIAPTPNPSNTLINQLATNSQNG